MKKLICSVIIFIVQQSTAFATNLGVYGELFPISEPDLSNLIHERLDQMQKNGQLKVLEDQIKQNTIAHVLRPAPVSGITTSTSPQTIFYDPTFTLPQDIYDDEGHVLAKAGTKINPLKTVIFNEALIFINSDDKNQINFAKSAIDYFAKAGKITKVILVDGNMKDAGTQLGRVYFDQSGVLTNKFGIQHVPAILTQQGLKLKIKEYIDDGHFDPEDASKVASKHFNDGARS